MNDDHIKEAYYLVTYEWREHGRHSGPNWKRDNQVIKGCPALWWAGQLEWYRKHEEAGREKAQEYAERGEKVPLSEVVNGTSLNFLYATPITRDGFDALDGVVG